MHQGLWFRVYGSPEQESSCRCSALSSRHAGLDTAGRQEEEARGGRGGGGGGGHLREDLLARGPEVAADEVPIELVRRARLCHPENHRSKHLNEGR